MTRPLSSALLTWLVTVTAAVAGSVIGYVDSRPGWDDTGVTAGALLLVAAGLAALRPGTGVVIGVLVGMPVVVFNAVRQGNYGSGVALATALVGAGIGIVIGKVVRRE